MRYLISAILLTASLNSIAQWSVLDTATSSKHEKWFLVQKFSPEEWNASNFASKEEMQWFNDARYGMFIHFGLSTYIGKELSWGMCQTRKAPDRMGGGQGTVADSIWTKYPEEFVFADFDAKKWVDIAKRAGMKYIVSIAKHHDGFHLWDTKYSDFKVTNTPFGRDYLKEIADACHEAGMKFGIYYSQRDWYHPDYEPVDTSLIKSLKTPPFYEAREGVSEIKPGPNHQKYIDYQFNVVRELCTNYGKVDIFWFDACWWGGMFTADMWQSEKLTRMIRELQPGIIINNRASIPGDFDTPEQKIGTYQARPWESCITLCHTWSWSDTPSKTKKQLVNILTATACGNGNTLLSWGSQWGGAFDPKQIARLEELGDWLKEYGTAIYNTNGGPWYPESWGGSTYRNNQVFVHVTDEKTNRIVLPTLNNQLLSAKCLTGGEVTFEQTSELIIIDLARASRSEESTIIKLEFQNNIAGMSSKQKRLSKFADPLYGTLIFEKKNLKTKGVSTIKLKQTMNVTGIGINGLQSASKGKFTVEVSADGKTWKEITSSEISKDENWELSVSNFNAGIELPGVETKYVRISTADKVNFQIEKLSIYGK